MPNTFVFIKNNIVLASPISGTEEEAIIGVQNQGITDYDTLMSVADIVLVEIGKDIREFNADTLIKKTTEEKMAELGVSSILDDETIILEDGIFKVVPDYTKRKIYDKETKQERYTSESGTSLPTEATEKVPPEDVYYIWSEPDDNWIIDITILREYKETFISKSFTMDISTGHFYSPSLGIDVDCRRSTAKNDLQNVQGLISYMTRNSITEIDYVGYSEIKVGATVSDLESLANEMEDHVLNLYQTKWTKQAEIQSATTITELEAVIW